MKEIKEDKSGLLAGMKNLFFSSGKKDQEFSESSSDTFSRYEEIKEP